MGSQLWIDENVRKWLFELRESEPRLARLVGEAVVALIDGGDLLGPPLVITQEVSPHLRRAIANVATSRKRLELIVGQLGKQAVQDASVREQISDLRRQLVILIAQEEQLNAASRRPGALVGPPPDGNMIKAVMLRPGVPDSARVGLLFTMPAPEVAVLLAQVTDPSASLGDYQAEIATHIAAVGLPGAGASAHRAFSCYGAKSFLDEFFAGEQAEVGVGAGALLARHRVHRLAEVRQRMELTQAQVAQRMNVRQERVSAIERTEPGAIEVRTLAAFVTALGGRLEIIAHIDDERITLAD